MKKYIISEKHIISMCDYLLNYCQFPSNIVFQYQNMPHERIRETFGNERIARFPLEYYRKEYSLLGVVLWVQDRTGKCLPYMSPLLLQMVTIEELIGMLRCGKDIQCLLEQLLLHNDVNVLPIPINPNIRTTRKKSFQKKMDRKRRERKDMYDEYERK